MNCQHENCTNEVGILEWEDYDEATYKTVMRKGYLPYCEFHMAKAMAQRD